VTEEIDVNLEEDDADDDKQEEGNEEEKESDPVLPFNTKLTENADKREVEITKKEKEAKEE